VSGDTGLDEAVNHVVCSADSQQREVHADVTCSSCSEVSQVNLEENSDESKHCVDALIRQVLHQEA